MSSSDVIKRLLSERVITYNPLLARALGKYGGAATAVFLCQLLAWQRESVRIGEAVFRTMEEWQEDTGLSRREVLRARHGLRLLGILHEERSVFPNRTFYRIDFDVVEHLLVESPDLRTRETREQTRAKRANRPARNARLERAKRAPVIKGTPAPAPAPSPSSPENEEAAAAARARTHEGDTEIEAALRLAWVRLFGEEKARAAAELIATKADELEGIPVGWVTDAVDEMQLSGGNTPNYLLAILRSWKEKGRSKPGRPLNFKTHSYYDEACKCGGDICIGGPQ